MVNCYMVSNASQLSKIAAWIVEQQRLQNPSVALCWASHHKATADYVKAMLQKRLSNIAVGEDDSGNIKAIIYFEFRDGLDKVTEKWATYASTIVDENDWITLKLSTFKELIRYMYLYYYSQNVFHAEFWVLETIFKCHQELFGDKFLTVLDEKTELPWGRMVRFIIDVKGAVEAAKT